MRKTLSISLVLMFLLISQMTYAGMPAYSTAYLLKVDILNVEPLDVTNIHKVSRYIAHPGRGTRSRGSADELAQKHEGFILEVKVLKSRTLDYEWYGSRETPINDSGWIQSSITEPKFYFYQSSVQLESLSFKKGDKKVFARDQQAGCDTFPPGGKCIFSGTLIYEVSEEYKYLVGSE